jgi:UDP-N-acetylglucosamine 2-epimerase
LVGANQLAGTNPEAILKAAESMSLAQTGWANPLGDGHTGEAIIKILLSKVAAT